jgi:hypothetical protein
MRKRARAFEDASSRRKPKLSEFESVDFKSIREQNRLLDQQQQQQCSSAIQSLLAYSDDEDDDGNQAQQQQQPYPPEVAHSDTSDSHQPPPPPPCDDSTTTTTTTTAASWQKMLDPESKEYYYYHPVTLETTWERPANFIDAPPAAVCAKASRATHLLLAIQRPIALLVGHIGAVYYVRAAGVASRYANSKHD